MSREITEAIVKEYREDALNRQYQKATPVTDECFWDNKYDSGGDTIKRATGPNARTYLPLRRIYEMDLLSQSYMYDITLISEERAPGFSPIEFHKRWAGKEIHTVKEKIWYYNHKCFYYGYDNRDYFERAQSKYKSLKTFNGCGDEWIKDKLDNTKKYGYAGAEIITPELIIMTVDTYDNRVLRHTEIPLGKLKNVIMPLVKDKVDFPEETVILKKYAKKSKEDIAKAQDKVDRDNQWLKEDEKPKKLRRKEKYEWVSITDKEVKRAARK